ncbi:MAG: hypothetical protein ABW210_05555 [Achromobacter sp.]
MLASLRDMPSINACFMATANLSGRRNLQRRGPMPPRCKRRMRVTERRTTHCFTRSICAVTTWQR